MGMVGVQELLVIGLIVMVIFGPRQLPKLGRAMGETIKEFRGVRKELEDVHSSVNDELGEVVRDLNQKS